MTHHVQSCPSPTPNEICSSQSSVNPGISQCGVSNEENPSTGRRNVPTPAQEVNIKKISLLEKQLVGLHCARDAMPNSQIEKQLKEKGKELETAKKDLKRQQSNVDYQKRSREAKKRKINEIIDKHPDVAELLKCRESAGRPCIEIDQPLLHKTIMDIAMIGSGTDERRRIESIRSIKTLSDLHAGLLEQGFELSR